MTVGVRVLVIATQIISFSSPRRKTINQFAGFHIISVHSKMSKEVQRMNKPSMLYKTQPNTQKVSDTINGLSLRYNLLSRAITVSTNLSIASFCSIQYASDFIQFLGQNPVNEYGHE